MSWSVVQFVHAMQFVCEDAGHFHAVVERRGDLTTSASVDFKQKSMSAQVREDYDVISPQTIHFEPGINYRLSLSTAPPPTVINTTHILVISG